MKVNVCASMMAFCCCAKAKVATFDPISYQREKSTMGRGR
jgi:hypothetical protein